MIPSRLASQNVNEQYSGSLLSVHIAPEDITSATKSIQLAMLLCSKNIIGESMHLRTTDVAVEVLPRTGCYGDLNASLLTGDSTMVQFCWTGQA